MKNFIQENKQYLSIWLPIVFSFGIILYFLYSFEPSIIILSLISLALAVLFFCLESKREIILLLFLLSFGQLVASTKAHIVKSPILKEEQVAYIYGNVSNIEIKPKYVRLTLENIDTDDIKYENLPKKIRLVVRTKIDNLIIGDRIGVFAKLTPPPQALLPGAYDFSRQAYFMQIGAVGFALSKVKNYEKNKNQLLSKIGNWRQIIVNDIKSYLPNDEANFTTALMVGDYSSISDELLNNLRIAGLSHILSVSGMHLSLVAIIFFFSIRLILNLSLNIAEKFDVKKIAALISILGTLFYLILSGWQVAAIRAFLMTSIILIAVIFDRQPVSLRTLAAAFGIILFFTPENVINPSFQMSFAAVLSLVTSYKIVQNFSFAAWGFFGKFINYFITLILSSLFAGLATAPFVAYYFNQFSVYSILANLIAVPITSFYIMPLMLISLMLYPLGLAKYFIILMSYGIKLIIKVTNYFANLPQAKQVIELIPDFAFFLLVLGFLLLCLWPNRFRYYGSACCFLVAIIIIKLNPKPDLIIFGKAKNFAIINEQSELVLGLKKITKHQKQTLLNWYNQKELNYLANHPGNFSMECDEDKCVFTKNNKKILINYSNKKFDADLEVDFNKGNYLIYIKDKIIIQDINKQKRLWSR